MQKNCQKFAICLDYYWPSGCARLTDFPISSVFYRASYAKRSLGSRNSVRLSVRPSVTRVLCDLSNEPTGDIFIPHERAIILVF